MVYTRLGDLVDSLDPEDPRRHRYDPVSKRIFNPELEIDEVPGMYVSATKPTLHSTLVPHLNRHNAIVGEFEAQILNKILNPMRPVLCLHGPMGCGKSTTKNYLIKLIGDRERVCARCEAPHLRLLGHVDLNHHRHLNDLAGERLSDAVATLLAREMVQARSGIALSKTEEFGDFWTWAFEKMAELQELPVFRAIRSDRRVRSEETPVSDAQVAVRENVIEDVIRQPHFMLGYEVLLWEHIINRHFGGQRSFAKIVLDNMDCLQPFVQKVIVNLVNSCARARGSVFVLLVRTETFEQRGLATRIMDSDGHQGPLPFRVIVDRLDRFLADPNVVRAASTELEDGEFHDLVQFLSRVRELLQGPSRMVVENLISRACGRSIRTGLLLAQRWVTMSQHDMRKADLGPHDLVRACLTAGAPQLRWRPNDIIEQLFRVSEGNPGALLVKPRILMYLNRHQDRARLSEIITAVGTFGQDESVICAAVNDMLRAECKLLKSGTFDRFERGAADDGGGHTVGLTEIGRGYAEHLMWDIDVVQELAFDTPVDTEFYERKTEFRKLGEKLYYTYLFLRVLRRQDLSETTQMAERWGVAAYRETFGNTLFITELVRRVWPSVDRILNTSGEKMRVFRGEYLLLRDYFMAMEIEVKQDNQDVLGIAVE